MQDGAVVQRCRPCSEEIYPVGTLLLAAKSQRARRRELVHTVVKAEAATPPGRAALHALSARQQLWSLVGGVAPRVAGMGTLGASAEVAPPLRFHVMMYF